MLHFSSVAELESALGGQSRWRRAAQAMRRGEHAPKEVTLSIGDAVTYRVTDQPDSVELTGHRRYLEVRHVVQGHTVIEVADQAALRALEAYDDLTDRQRFTGAGNRNTLGQGVVVIAQQGEALRDIAVHGQVMVLRVTVDGVVSE